MKFIPRGAVRVESDTPEGKRLFSNAAFRTPGGKMVLVVANAERNHTAFSVRCGEQAFDAALPAGTVATYVWTPARQPLSGALP